MGESFELLINAFFMNEIDTDEWITGSAASKMTHRAAVLLVKIRQNWGPLSRIQSKTVKDILVFVLTHKRMPFIIFE